MKSTIQPRKQLGQHFLQDDRYCRKIVDALDLSGSSPIVEIGPGTGALTRFIYPQTGSLYTGIEIDPRAVADLRKKFGPEIRIIEGDFMETSPTAWLPKADAVQIVGNLPYYITTPILFRILDLVPPVSRTVIMVQREVAERMVAVPGTKEYGILSVRFQQAASLKLITRVPPGAFHPPPTVDSAVVTLNWYTYPPEKPMNMAHFELIVRSAFHARRKTLKNNLQGLFRSGLPDGMDWSRRAETLRVAEFVTLSDFYTRTVTPNQEVSDG